MLSAGQDSTLRLWSLSTGQLLRTLTGHTDYITCVAVTPDRHLAVSGGVGIQVAALGIGHWGMSENPERPWGLCDVCGRVAMWAVGGFRQPRQHIATLVTSH